MMGARDSVLCLGGEVEKSEKLNQSSLFLLAVQYSITSYDDSWDIP